MLHWEKKISIRMSRRSLFTSNHVCGCHIELMTNATSIWVSLFDRHPNFVHILSHGVCINTKKPFLNACRCDKYSIIMYTYLHAQTIVIFKCKKIIPLWCICYLLSIHSYWMAELQCALAMAALCFTCALRLSVSSLCSAGNESPAQTKAWEYPRRSDCIPV